MRIESAQVILNNQYQFQRSEERTQHIERRELPTQAAATPPPINAVTSQTLNMNSSLQTSTNVENIAPPSLLNLDMKTHLLKALVEAMIGEKINIADDPSQFQPTASTETTTIPTEQVATEPANNPTMETTTITLTKIQEYEYSEVDISAALIDDQGLSLNINYRFTMERSYQQQDLSINITRGPLTDPLVINFNGANVKLNSELIDFDLDSDGFINQIASLGSNSAYIALDKNGDGIINNGSELFGPTTGNGFIELTKFDEDGNGFIDEGDSVFSQLIAFRPGDGYQQNLASLGVGALFTGSVDSPFSLTDSDNNLLGKVRASGFYLMENGKAGSLQQIDLVV